MIFEKLWKIDTKGKIRVWYMEIEGDKYRTISGLEDGKLVTTKWKVALPKNIGKINATTAEQQALLEIEAEYTHQMYQGGYSKSKENMGTKYFEPMLAKKYEDFVKKPSWPVYTQPKLDGVRCIVNKDGMWSREGKPIISAPHIFDEIKVVFDDYPDLVLDGELYNHKLRDDFNKIISLAKKTKPTQEDLEASANMIEYHIYDLMLLNNTDLNFVERYPSYIDWTYRGPGDSRVRLVETYFVKDQNELDEYYAQFLEAGYEGQMIRFNKPYENKRSKYLIKRKEFQDEEFEVLKIEEGVGNWAGYAKSITCKNKDDKIFSSGVRGNQDFTKELLTRNIKYVTVRYQNLTPDGIPRFPVAVAFYEEKRDM